MYLICLHREAALLIREEWVVSKAHLYGWCRDSTVRNGLEYVATWNSAQMLSQDMDRVIESLARKSKQPPRFSKL